MKSKFLLFPISLILASPLIAGQFIWTGSTDSTWTDASNWDITSAAPVSTDTYPIPGNTYASDFLVIKNNGDFITPGVGAVYNPGPGVTTTFSGGRCFVVGIGTVGTNGFADLEIKSGTIAAPRTTNSGSEPYMANRTTSNLWINGGALDLSGNANNFRLIQEGQAGITSTITITSGSLTCALLDLIYDTEATPATVFGDGIINLDGGVLELNRFNRSAASDFGQTSFKINLNGGILRARNTNTNFLPSLADTQVVVKSGGAKIDTNGFNSTIAAGLAHDSALGLTLDGGVTKIGAGSLILDGANTYTGGFINNGSGNVIPRTDDAFGTGTVVSNAGKIYPNVAVTFGNPLTLSNSTLQIGGAGSKTITWNGPVAASGTSGISADSGTSGITLTNTLDITGATFTSFANGTTNNIDGIISGAGGNLEVTSGTLQISGINTYTGTTTLSGSAVLRPQSTGTISNSSNVIINGTGNFNIRNTDGWVYTGTISGAGSGSINLNTGTNTTLAGSISGVAGIAANSEFTDTTVSGNISGPVNVSVQGAAILTLSGNNSAMSGGVTLSGSTFGTQLNINSATGLGTGTLSMSGSSGRIDNTSGSALTLSTNNTQTWNGDFSFLGTNSLNLGTGAVTLGGNRTVTVANSLTVGGAIGGAFGITKANAGNLVLTGASDYTGDTNISQGTLTINSIKDYGVNSAIGAPLSGDIHLGSSNNFCNLVYTGSGDSTNRTVQLGNTNALNDGVGSIKNNGSGALTFTAANLNPVIVGITTTRTLWLGGTYTGGSNEFQGIIKDNDVAGKVNVGKGNDASIWTLSGANTYTGSTIVQGGALKLGATGSIAGSPTVSINAGATFDTSAQASYTIPSGQSLALGVDAGGAGSSGRIVADGLNISNAAVTYNISGTPNDPAYVLATYTPGQLSGTFLSVPTPPAGYILNYAYQGNKIALVQAAAGGYSAWQTANSTTGALDADHDNDGVKNGVEYFLGGNTNTTGFTALPGVTNTAGNLSVTWTKATTGYAGVYTTDFVVETSTTLASGSWTAASTSGTPATADTVYINGNNVTYTFPVGTKKFARLKVTGP